MSSELFSFHLAELPLYRVPGILLTAPRAPGLLHGERCLTMHLGERVASPRRYETRRLAFFGWWRDEDSLEEYLAARPELRGGWHIRMHLYRRWGATSELAGASAQASGPSAGQPVVAFTLARLRLSQAPRFVRWGRPVEAQVRDHAGQVLAMAGIRPPNHFCTFSIWKTEAEMTRMVFGGGQNPRTDESHRLAMQERLRRDFHHEFMTMRFRPFKECGRWDGRDNYAGVPSLIEESSSALSRVKVSEEIRLVSRADPNLAEGPPSVILGRCKFS